MYMMSQLYIWQLFYLKIMGWGGQRGKKGRGDGLGSVLRTEKSTGSNHKVPLGRPLQS